MNKTLLALLVAASLGTTLAGCSSDSDPVGDPTAAGNDPLTGLPLEDATGVSDPTDVSGGGSADAPVDTSGGTGSGVATDPASDSDSGSGPNEAPVRDTSFGPAQLSPGNLDAVVSKVFGIYAGAAYGERVLALPPYPGLRGLPLGEDWYQGTTTRTDTCDNGGTARLVMDYSGDRVVTYDRRGAFDDCQSGALTIDGEIELLDVDNVSVASSGLTVTEGAEVRSFSGGVGYGDGNNYGGANGGYWNASDVDWTVRDGDYTDYSITDANTRFGFDGGYNRTLSGSFTLLYGGTAGSPVRVDTPVAFEADGPDYAAGDTGPGDWHFKAGTLRMVAEDGSRILIEADNGDPDSARVTLDYAGQTDTFDKPWSDWDAVLRAGPSPTR